jgi:hypothetical protein
VIRGVVLAACVACLVTELPAEAENAVCPPETAWDGIACAHARATCGAWDGTSCEPESVALQTERAIRAEFSRIDEDAHAICSEEAAEVYPGSALDVLKAADAAIHRADAIDVRLEELRNRAASPDWSVATLARAGSLYDCIWSSFAAATPGMLTAQQQAALNRLGPTIAQLNSAHLWAQANLLQQAISGTAQQAEEHWLLVRDKYIDWITRKIVIRYVTAALLARRYATEAFALSRASERLPFVATALGPVRMAGILATLPDPTDPTEPPESRRHILYFDGAFGR